MATNYESKGLNLYMREVSKTELITLEEEIKLAARIKEGDEAAREHLIKANLRLVVKIARDYSGFGVSMTDLISEGNMGLIKAVERFDPEKGGKLSTYAAWWIKNAIKKALSNQSKTIRLPIHITEKLARVRRVSNFLAEELGRQPTDEELSEELGLPLKKLLVLKQYTQSLISLNAPFNDEENIELGEKICDEKALDPSVSLENKNLHAELDDLLGHLDSRESDIIDSRFGLNGKKPMTLEEIGHDFGLSRERIRQLQNVALNKMYRVLMSKEKRSLYKAES